MKQSLTHEQLRLLVATMINDENTDYAQTTARLNPYPASTTKDLTDLLTYAHKEKLRVLEALYRELQ